MYQKTFLALVTHEEFKNQYPAPCLVEFFITALSLLKSILGCSNFIVESSSTRTPPIHHVYLRRQHFSLHIVHPIQSQILLILYLQIDLLQEL